jgi:nucleoside-diphosphate-sugar epimerase
MKIIVTGGSGNLGRHVVRDLQAAGHQVLSLDRVRPSEPLCPSWDADLRHIGHVYEALSGAEGVIHLAAYQAPNLAPDSETFDNNVSATYNVFKAAADLRVPHVVFASSVAAYGFIYAPSMRVPDYLPLDEQHPCRPQDPYGLSKVFGEQVADAFASMQPMSVASLRFPGVIFDLTYASFPERWKEPTRRLGGFWSYIDARDAARACRLAVEATLNGHEVFNVAAPTSSMPLPTDELVRRHLPELRSLKEGLVSNWSGMDSSRFEQRFGFRARHTWQQYLTPEGTPLPPESSG